MRLWKLPLIVLAVIAALSAIISRWAGLGFWAIFAIFVVAWLVNGLVATIEDDLPGGFNNPNGDATPRYIVGLKWLVRGVVAIGVLVGLAIMFMVVRGKQ